MRQVQIIVGAMVIVGVVLGLFVWPYFSLIGGFFGLGLLSAGEVYFYYALSCLFQPKRTCFSQTLGQV